MKNSTITKVVLFGSLSIIGIIAIQAYLLYHNWDAQEKKFQEKVTIALLNVVREFEKLGSSPPAYDIVSQISSDYYVVNINDNIRENDLEYFLRRELEKVGLREDFEYGVYNCDTKKMAYGKYISYSTGVANTKPVLPREQLPVYDEYLYYFGVRFPKRTTQILTDMRLTLVFAGILLITILFFLYSIFIILRQKRLSEMQKDFINNMTHEFKTPISTIHISAEVLMKSPEIQANPRLLQYTSIIADQNQRLNNQVEKVLQLAKIEKENFRLNLEQIDLHALINDILKSVKIQVEKQGGTLISFLDAQKTMVRADKIHLTNVIYNLLDNAIKYCKESPAITIRTTDQRDGRIALAIQDAGVGIAKENLAKIFEKFYRVPTGDVHNVKGFGLGLFYTKNICDAHGWKITIDSEAGKGTTVKILM